MSTLATHPHASTLHQHFAATLDQWFGDNLPANLLVGISGGLDSSVLLDLASIWARSKPVKVWAGHVNYQVDPSDAAAELHVRQRCAKLGCGLFIRQVPAIGANQDTLRRLRLPALAEVAKACGAEHILLAHHRDDVVESLVMHHQRGLSPRRFGGIPSQSPCFGGKGVTLLRPLLAVRRHDLADYAARAAIRWVEDASNTDLRHARNRARHQLLPALRDFAGPSVDERLATLAQRLSRRNQRRIQLASRQVRVLAGKDIEVDLAAGVTAEALLAAIQAHLPDFGISPRALSAKRLQRLLELPNGESYAFATLRATRCPNSLRLVLNNPLPNGTQPNLPATDCFVRVGKGLTTVPWAPMFEEVAVHCHGDSSFLPTLTLRSCRLGDRIHLASGGRKKLVHLMRERGVAVELRQFWPVLESEGRLIWVPGLGIDDRSFLPENARNALNFTCRLSRPYKDARWQQQPPKLAHRQPAN